MSGFRIMVVEDDSDVRDGLTEILSMDGFEVITARDGEEAWKLLTEHVDPVDISLILLDYTMPRMDAAGFRSLQKNDRRLNSIPVILFSAASLPEPLVAALEVSHVLRKPADMEVILEAVRRFATR